LPLSAVTHKDERAACVAGEKLQDADVDSILKFTGTEEDLDGNIKYEGKVAFRGKSVNC